MTELEQSREIINKVDKQIADLFEQRMDAVKVVAEYKKKYGLQIYDATREQEICNKEVEYISNQEYKPYYLDLVHSLMDVSKKYQSMLVKGCRVAYCGVPGAWACIASKRIFPNGSLVSFPSFAQAYQAVEKGECDFAVLPVENSFAGDVSQVFDLLHKGSLFVNGMYNLRISQALLGPKGAKVSDVKKVMSHQQALDQCMDFLKDHNFEIMAVSNTAKAAKDVAEMNDFSVAAIASEESAKIYKLDVLEREINQNAFNTTRFAVLSRVMPEETKKTKDTTFQVMFTVKNIPGSLAKAVKAFGDSGFNMNSLRSRPIKDVPWEYYFYVEGEGSLFSKEGQALIDSLKTICDEVKILGHYDGEKDI